MISMMNSRVTDPRWAWRGRDADVLESNRRGALGEPRRPVAEALSCYRVVRNGPETGRLVRDRGEPEE